MRQTDTHKAKHEPQLLIIVSPCAYIHVLFGSPMHGTRKRYLCNVELEVLSFECVLLDNDRQLLQMRRKKRFLAEVDKYRYTRKRRLKEPS